MTEYLKKSFTVRFHGNKAKERCAKCGMELQEVIYKLNHKPHCHACFKKPKGA